MDYTYLIPSWFFGFDIGMEILFTIISFLVAYFAVKVYDVTKEKKIKLFAIAFLLIGLSYAILGGLNYWFMHAASEGFRQVTVNEVQIIGVLSLYAYMVLFISGLVTLTHVIAGMRKGKTYYLLLGLSLLVIASSLDKMMTFRILAVFLLSFIAYQYFVEYLKSRDRKEAGVLIAFILLLLGNLDFMFSSSYYQAYVIGHMLELVAYLLILGILIKSVKK